MACGFQKSKPRPQVLESHAKSLAWPGFGLQAEAGTSLIMVVSHRHTAVLFGVQAFHGVGTVLEALPTLYTMAWKSKATRSHIQN